MNADLERAAKRLRAVQARVKRLEDQLYRARQAKEKAFRTFHAALGPDDWYSQDGDGLTVVGSNVREVA